MKTNLFEALTLKENAEVKDYFVICTMYDDVIAYGSISAFDADEAMCDFFDETEIAYSGEYDDEYGEFDWDNLTRYVWELDGTETLPKTDAEAEAWLRANSDSAALEEGFKNE